MIKKLLDLYTKLSKREKTILYATAFVLAGCLAVKLVIEPIQQKTAQLENRIRDEESAIKQSLHVLLQKDRVTLEDKQFAAYKSEPRDPEREMVSLLKEIESLAATAGVSLQYVKPASAEGAASKKYLASLECESQMEQIITFFHAIESSPMLLKIEKYSIQPKAKESSLARCTVLVSKAVLGKKS